jgi:hypothetical protein
MSLVSELLESPAKKEKNGTWVSVDKIMSIGNLKVILSFSSPVDEIEREVALENLDFLELVLRSCLSLGERSRKMRDRGDDMVEVMISSSSIIIRNLEEDEATMLQKSLRVQGFSEIDRDRLKIEKEMYH